MTASTAIARRPSISALYAISMWRLLGFASSGGSVLANISVRGAASVVCHGRDETRHDCCWGCLTRPSGRENEFRHAPLQSKNQLILANLRHCPKKNLRHCPKKLCDGSAMWCARHTRGFFSLANKFHAPARSLNSILSEAGNRIES